MINISNYIDFSGIRGGLVQASMRYAQANNLKTPDYDNTKPNSWLVYQDCKYYIFIFIEYIIIYFISRQQFVWMGDDSVYAIRWIQVGYSNIR